MMDSASSQASAPAGSSKASPRNSMLVGAFIALFGVSCYSLFGLFGVVNVVMPYVAGVGMFVALLSIFSAIIATLKRARRSNAKQVVIWDCYAAVAVIGVMGYFLAACVQTFQPDGNAAEYWSNGAVAAAVFAMLFGGGKYIGQLLAAGKNSK